MSIKRMLDHLDYGAPDLDATDLDATDLDATDLDATEKLQCRFRGDWSRSASVLRRVLAGSGSRLYIAPTPRIPAPRRRVGRAIGGRMTESEHFSTDVTQVDGATVIHVHGEIDMATCEHLRDALEPHLGPRQSIVLDLSGVKFMDSSCLNVLVQARGTLTADGGSLVLRNPSALARRILTATGIEHLLEDAEPATSHQTTSLS